MLEPAQTRDSGKSRPAAVAWINRDAASSPRICLRPDVRMFVSAEEQAVRRKAAEM